MLTERRMLELSWELDSMYWEIDALQGCRVAQPKSNSRSIILVYKSLLLLNAGMRTVPGWPFNVQNRLTPKNLAERILKRVGPNLPCFDLI